MSVINSGAVISRALNFVSKNGDTMSGSLIMNNDIDVQGKETGGTARSLIKMNASNQIELGNTTNINIVPNTLRLTVNNKALQGVELGGTVRDLIKINTNDRVFVGSTTNRLDLAGSIIVISPNNISLSGVESGGTARNLIKMNASNQVEIGNAANINRSLHFIEFNNNVGVSGRETGAIARILLRLNASDQVELGNATNRNIATNDLEFTDQTKGIILDDRTDANKYRIFVDNGVLSTEIVV